MTSSGTQVGNTTFNNALQSVQSQTRGEVEITGGKGLGTVDGNIRFGDSTKNNVKMAVLIQRVFPSRFKTNQYIGLQQGGTLDGAIINNAPSVYSIACGEKPVEEVAGVWYARNGDIIIGAPKGRVTIFARDIDLIASGNGTKTGHVSISADATINGYAGNEVSWDGGDAVAISSRRNININSTQLTKISAGSFRTEETPSVNPTALIANLGSPGQNTILQTAESVMKLITTILG